jgi:hypothetical protein
VVGDAHKREIERSADIMNVLRERREVEDMRIKEYMKCKELITSVFLPSFSKLHRCMEVIETDIL